jgi:sigma-E factor negative regulatory protein RseB
LSPSRTVVIGSAVPLILLIGLVVLPPGRLVAEIRGSAAETVTPPTAILVRATTRAVSNPAQAARQEVLALAQLRRSVRSGADLGFTGTEVVSSWYPRGSTTRVLHLNQNPGGARTTTAEPESNDVNPSAAVAGASVADPLAAFSDRALVALAAAYQLRLAGTDSVAGRSSTVVVADRDGAEMARLWLDDATGLLLRQDVMDQAGRLQRMATFVALRTRAGSSTATGGRAKASGSVRAAAAPATKVSASSTGWSDIDLKDLSRWRAEGWPCLTRLAAGYVLLDARRGTSSGGAPVLHLTYSDGLTAISVFLQHGQLDDSRLTGLTSADWDGSVVHLRDGWPEVMVWQGGETVITAVGEADPAQLRSVLAALPRQPKRGTLGSLQHDMGSALTWFTG